MDWPLVFIIVLLASFTQSVSGFGVALVSMSLLAILLGVAIAAPLVALIALATEIILLVAFRQALNLRVVWQLAAASAIGVPLGVLGLRQLDEQLVLSVLGLVIAGYALYALFDLRLPSTRGSGWAWGAGFLAGVLGGAYNTSGPPVIIFGHSRRWSPTVFKANLQGFFVLNSVLVLGSHLLAGNLTRVVWGHNLVALPAVAVGTWAGLRLSNRINPDTFGRLVLWLLVVVGVVLILP